MGPKVIAEFARREINESGNKSEGQAIGDKQCRAELFPSQRCYLWAREGRKIAFSEGCVATSLHPWT